VQSICWHGYGLAFHIIQAAGHKQLLSFDADIHPGQINKFALL